MHIYTLSRRGGGEGSTGKGAYIEEIDRGRKGYIVSGRYRGWERET